MSFQNQKMKSIRSFYYNLMLPNRILLHRRLQHDETMIDQKLNLSFAISEAEKVVGYPTSFLNLRWLLTDEFANIAIHFRKLILSNHPLLETARKLFIGNNNIPSWGLMVLLISKAFGLNSKFCDTEKDSVAGVLHSQRALAEITEMLRTSNLIHRNILNKDEIQSDLNFGNKITLLSGDYLLAKSYQELAYLRNSHLNEFMYAAVRDMVDSEFMGLRDKKDQPYPSMPLHYQKDIQILDNFGNDPYEIQEVLGYPVAEWTLRTILASGSLLGKSCQGALHLAKHSKELQNLGYLIGRNVALICQTKIEQEAFVRDDCASFSLVSAPVMLHFKDDPSLYKKIVEHKDDTSQVNYEELKKIIEKGPALENIKKLQNEFLVKTMDLLQQLPSCGARTALENIIISTKL